MTERIIAVFNSSAVPRCIEESGTITRDLSVWIQSSVTHKLTMTCAVRASGLHVDLHPWTTTCDVRTCHQATRTPTDQCIHSGSTDRKQGSGP